LKSTEKYYRNNTSLLRLRVKVTRPRLLKRRNTKH